MGAAQDQGLGAPFEHRVEVGVGDLVGDRVVAPSFFGERNEQGAGEGPHIDTGRQQAISIASSSGLSRDEIDEMKTRYAEVVGKTAEDGLVPKDVRAPP